jgi:hypothetical protein
MSDDPRIRPGRRYRVLRDPDVAVAEARSVESSPLHRLPRSTIVVVAEISSDAGKIRARLSSPAGWVDAEALGEEVPVPSLRLDYKTFMARQSEVAPGDTYGLEFPITLETLRDAGPDFLTEAFRAAGTISTRNRVTEIVSLDSLGLIGASSNAFLEVAYAEPEPGLATRLFVKLPPEEPNYKFGLSAMFHGEVALARRSREGLLPVPVAKYYFGDYCSSTTNSILITERIPYGEEPIEPAYRKGRDDEVPEIEEHYRVLAEAQARLVAAHKKGDLGHDLEEDFPFPRARRNFAVAADAEEKIDRLIDFVEGVGSHFFLPETTTRDFLARWREDLLFGLEHKDAVLAYLIADVDYTGLCHTNLNVDNAWYWRDEAGDLQVGLIDFGGFGQLSIAQALSGMLMMPDPERYLALQRSVIADFVRRFEAEGGRRLDPVRLLFELKASVFSTAIGTILEVVVGLLDQYTEAEWASMADRFDPRLQNDGGGMASAIIWFDNVLRDWTDDPTPGEACRRIVAGTAS